jgi:hypothetical protein
MAGIRDSWRQCAGRESYQVFGALDHQALPELSALLGGEPDNLKTGWDRPPLSLLLFADGNVIRWCISSERFPRQLWGACASLTDALLLIEDDLCKERCSWRNKKESDNGFTHGRR